MCGIAGFFSQESLKNEESLGLLHHLNSRQAHRGPDGSGVWVDASGLAGFAHVRLSIIDLSSGHQPMVSDSGNVITFNGEIYNYIELRQELGVENFKTTSDTEVVLKAYEAWGPRCVEKFRGMFAFAIWDADRRKVFVARDRFGIKPFYYTVQEGVFYFASEIKTLTSLVPSLSVNLDGLRDYFSFQFCLGEKTLFDGIYKLLPAHCGYLDFQLDQWHFKYWEVQYDLDWHHTEKYFIDKVRELMYDSVRYHTRSDVEVASYLSGGVDSSIVTCLARDVLTQGQYRAFTGKFSLGEQFDESRYARILSAERDISLYEADIVAQDFIDNIAKVIYHLDEPVAGPGSFPQFMVSRLVRDTGIKVVLGGQGGDEIFGGYARYLIAYFEQCIKGALDGTMNNGKYIVNYESIIPNLVTLKNYKPLIKEFWSEGLFDSRDERYYRLVNRSNQMGDIIHWEIFNKTTSFDEFKKIYWSENVGKESYFDSMTHFDFKTLLPALLQVEDRMSMANGIESRVPFLDHSLVELAATIPANIKFQNGELKRLLRNTFSDVVPAPIMERKDKMGFPVPLQVWFKENANVRDFVCDIFQSQNALHRLYLSDSFSIESLISKEGQFNRNIWGLLNLELWQQQFFDNHQYFSWRDSPVNALTG
jgi:asparagine synthase (glutamine-hydrolysing)